MRVMEVRALPVLLAVVLFSCQVPESPFAPTDYVEWGTSQGPGLTITASTATYSGEYAPDNCVVIYITDANDQFVRTVGLWSEVYMEYLTGWAAAAGYHWSWALDPHGIDGWTAASRVSHSDELTVHWDMTDTSGTAVPDGTYKVWIEITEDNASGHSTSAAVVIDAAPKTVAIPPTTGITNAEVQYIPLGN